MEWMSFAGMGVGVKGKGGGEAAQKSKKQKGPECAGKTGEESRQARYQREKSLAHAEMCPLWLLL